MSYFLHHGQKSSELMDGGAFLHLVLTQTAQPRSRKMENKRAAAGVNELLMPGTIRPVSDSGGLPTARSGGGGSAP